MTPVGRGRVPDDRDRPVLAVISEERVQGLVVLARAQTDLLKTDIIILKMQ